MRYLNTSRSVKTFYGVTFKPGDAHDVPNFINWPGFVRVPEEAAQPNAAATESTESTKSTKSTTGSKTSTTQTPKSDGSSAGTDTQ